MPGVIGHRTLAERVQRSVVRGVPAVSACDAWCQLASTLSHDDLVAAGDRLLGWPRPLATVDELDRRRAASGGRRAAHRDVERLNDLAAAGWIVIRVGRRLPPARALDQLERALRSRGWRGARSSA
ncbi:hypothetical protein [Agromyces sp. ZXT2-6]|uniref:hypothetical protein n=1 Tax=Agromyces sp. ZXT2-6 TaxID=3461153 RepID=UPI004054F9B2